MVIILSDLITDGDDSEMFSERREERGEWAVDNASWSCWASYNGREDLTDYKPTTDGWFFPN